MSRLSNMRHLHSVKTPNITQIPDFTKYSPVRPINEELAPYIYETMKAFPSRSHYINQQHYYHNKNVLINDYLKKNPTPVSLTQLAQYYDDSTTLTKQKVISSAKFVKEEISIRMAHKIHSLQLLPFNVINNFHFVQVYESYYNIFERFRKFPAVRTLDDSIRFTKFARDILKDFNTLNLPHLIMGALECTTLDLYPTDKMDKLLSDLLRARISRRLIVEEHISIADNYFSGKKKNTLVLGDIFQECSAKEHILGASKICEKFIQDMYFESIPMPELKINGETDLKFYFLPSHLKYLLGEILRNTYEATIKDYIRKGLPKPEPIVITIIKNEESYLFRICDRAGGLAHHHDDNNIWSFGKTKEQAAQSISNFHKLPGLQTVSLYDHLYNNTEDRQVNRAYINTSLEPMAHSNIASAVATGYEVPLLKLLKRSFRYKLGIGLAMCKVYAEYWNGDLTLHSIHGFGTDTVLKLGNLMIHTKDKQLDRV
ncbi:uncharacterized protein GVI51_F06611 [Nakaseomyces glabratus]|uniref:Protein-serine/threonine kinase n=2 Tax=Candida glabrata TaxID=5478 RepID=Q6FU21_CANGA|nr:uncharacterized protein CAGL0F07007g [Nakaseomyces glabratus]KAH7587764.1 Mitochondrial branched-chain alpha-ketoacid dehydrogenase kinase [Nakaseomyces glabratus]KAH7589578.1 Mitochondrial branched-chain alpha-ketoacid dehydrogenase kinase [Nakaseomyces glabratus]KAH7594749.1 Mitochondrial branched-chain alpha-ketoacid dehydrogenase kinase [Nakaseomyces glabratus]KAH7604247.1 Mitochondrial branched-chain alpha-ketoacid dehydrogenase kinase [Nakaseomyces glabratus]KAH7605233.1 Mitochondrial|eukprot:XP_446273.1 uncharacterized protein CAGL0F07007g [[Candida] glabrata]